MGVCCRLTTIVTFSSIVLAVIKLTKVPGTTIKVRCIGGEKVPPKYPRSIW